MSRSRRYHPAMKIAGSSDKRDKRMANRAFRRIEKILVSKGRIPPLRVREVRNTWSFSSDGLACYMREPEEKFMRK